MRAAKVTALIGLSAQLLLLGPSSAADYPSRPIKLLVGASAGGTTDTMARTIAQPLSNLFGEPVLVEDALELAFSRALSVLPIASYIGTTGGTTPQARGCGCPSCKQADFPGPLLSGTPKSPPQAPASRARCDC